MPKLKDLRGKRFGGLIVLDEKPIRINKVIYWNCRCDCGNQKLIFSGNLVQGKVKSCGCQHYRKDGVNERLVNIFKGMKQRCYYAQHERYKSYGGRGIKICDEWLNDRKKFYDWALSNGYKDNLSIDRIDVDGDYEPNNCRWVTMKVQQNNRTNNRKIIINGKTKTASQWAEEYGITHGAFVWRYENNKI